MSVTWTPPTVADFQAFFNRDFPYAGPDTPATDLAFVQPADINKAISQGQVNFSPGMFDINSGQSTTVFMYLAAFYLVEDLKLSNKGINAQTAFPTTAIGAGNVNVAMQPPEKFLSNPTYAMFTRNAYGMQYLSFVYPYTIGAMHIAPGTSTFS